MKKFFRKVALPIGASLFLIFVNIFTSQSVTIAKENPTSSTVVSQTNFDPWTVKPVLSYLFETQDPKLKSDLSSLKNTLSLTDIEFNEFATIAQNEAVAVNRIKEVNDLALAKGQNLDEKREVANSFNKNINDSLKSADQHVQELLNNKYQTFREWIKTWWSTETSYRSKQNVTISPLGSDTSYVLTLYATQYNANTQYEVALPDKYLKYSYLGWPRPSNYNGTYSVLLTNGTYSTYADVKEVGPWNEDDNYWDTTRRLFNDLSRGQPEADYAFYYNYNGGKDQFGRTVLNPAGIDLSPAVASSIGLGSNQSAWIKVDLGGLP